MKETTKPLGDHETLFGALLHAEVALWNRLEKTPWQTANPVTLACYLVLKRIDTSAADDGPRVQNVARRQYATIGVTPQLVGCLIGDGLVARAPYPKNQRSCRLSLIDRGRIRMESAAGAFEGILYTVFVGFRHEELVALTRNLTRVAVKTSQWASVVPTVQGARLSKPPPGGSSVALTSENGTDPINHSDVRETSPDDTNQSSPVRKRSL